VLRVLAIGLAPFLAWELFALIYYGTPFPNSAYAKLATGIPRTALIRQGLLYFLNSLRVDPVTLCVIGGAVVFAVRRRERDELLLMAGAWSYLVYVLFIGGDFMSGRFFSAPLIVAAAVLSRWRPVKPGFVEALPFIILILSGLAVPAAPLFSGADYAQRQRGRLSDGAHITDERAFYYNETGLLRAGRRDAPMPDHPSAHDGRRAREAGPAVVVRGGVGFFGYYAGSRVHVIEPWAVTDPLLARLPIPDGASWRIGHFARAIPRGYQETLETGDLRLTDPGIARLYTALGIVMRGPLFGGRRMVEIWRLNTGFYGGK
jgi:arabinofuranosyltransferase